jgi:hypothetical protein
MFKIAQALTYFLLRDLYVPSYLMRPDYLNLFENEVTRGSVVPIMSASGIANVRNFTKS